MISDTKMYYNRNGRTKRAGNCYAVLGPNNTEIYCSYSTIVAFKDRNGEIWTLDRSLSNTTSRHVSSLSRHAFAPGAKVHRVASDLFWDTMHRNDITEYFRYRGTGYDSDPRGRSA